MTERDKAIEALDVIAGCGCCTTHAEDAQVLGITHDEARTLDRDEMFGLVLDRYVAHVLGNVAANAKPYARFSRLAGVSANDD